MAYDPNTVIAGQPATQDIDAGTNKVINLATPTAATDGATKAYVDAATGGSFAQQGFTATLDQTVFTLSTAYKGAGGSVAAWVNGVGAEKDVDFTISGTTFTWLDTLYTMKAGWRLVVDYQTA